MSGTLKLISSWNGGPAISRAIALRMNGAELLPALVEGVKLVEDDPEEMSVGFGGLPNEDGVVELDAAVMDGKSHRAGAVAGLKGYRYAAAVAHEVMRRTDHSLLVGEGACRFAQMMGFRHEELLTPAGRQAWLEWKANLSPRDAWLAEGEGASDYGRALWAGRGAGSASESEQAESGAPKSGLGPNQSGGLPREPFTFGTIYLGGIDEAGDLCALTSTSGLSYKIAGRVGDTPVVGGGLYVDNEVGTAGATGRGEAVMQSCGSFYAVSRMEAGDSPEQACMAALKKIVDRTRQKRLRDEQGKLTFNVTMYAIRKDGAIGAASIHPGYEFVVFDGETVSVKVAASLYSG